jgi:glutamate racemase
VVGVIEPGAQQAAAVTRTKKAVVIGTEATISSHAYRNALAKLHIESHEKACPLLVPLVEEGWIDHGVTKEIAGIYLAEAFADGFSAADVLLLGCTHYPLLKPVLQRVVPKGVTLVDSAESTAQTVARLFNREAKRPDQTTPANDSAKIKFFVTDSAQKFQRLGKLFLGRPMTDVTHVELKE